jgi:hypothetical protein
MDFVPTWKVVSIALTGAFGILGLVKDFKDKQTNQITRWGRVSLAGILISTCFGIVAQFKESSEQQASSAKNQARMLEILSDIQLNLSPFSAPFLNFTFAAPCDHFEDLCECVKNTKNLESQCDKHLPNMNVKFFIFRDAKEADQFINGDLLKRGDLSMTVLISPETAAKSDAWLRLSSVISEDNKNYVFIVTGGHGFEAGLSANIGTITSIMDLAGATIVMFAGAPSAKLQIKIFNFWFKNGERLAPNAKPEEVHLHGRPSDLAYRYTFPKH